MTLKSLNPYSDVLSDILKVVSDLRQTVHMLDDFVQELMNNGDIKKNCQKQRRQDMDLKMFLR
jgi:hypothetical protein